VTTRATQAPRDRGSRCGNEVSFRRSCRDSLPVVVCGVAALPSHASGRFPDHFGDDADVWPPASGAAVAHNPAHGSSVGSNAPVGRRNCSPAGGTSVVETGPFFAKMSLNRYLVLVPREVLLPLGRPEGLVFSPSGTFFWWSIFGWLSEPHARTHGSVYWHSPSASRPYVPVFPAVHASPKDAFSARTNLSSRSRIAKTGGSKHGRTRS